MTMDWRPPVQLIGPMTGKPEFNYPMFNLVAGALRSSGWTVGNPAEYFGGAQDRLIHEYLAASAIDLALYARGIVALPGWQDSPGARLEAQIAINLRYDTFFWDPHHGLRHMDRRYVVDVLSRP